MPIVQQQLPSSADGESVPSGGAHDFAFQTGEWRVRHRKLKRRLVGDATWINFEGRCTAWELLDGQANVDDHLIDDPGGRCRGASLRRFDTTAKTWAIWWWDSRLAEIGPPVHGRFANGVGLFSGDDTLAGREIKVRYIWSGIEAHRARWEQAFSADAGATWETNWIMEFSRP